ncbi:hypothetical protein CHCC5027_1834 [Bacillus paralicheniformis]|nr:hypothetical protein CHCC5027_1834 [Bacillus paralicheniformis]
MTSLKTILIQQSGTKQVAQPVSSCRLLYMLLIDLIIILVLMY